MFFVIRIKPISGIKIVNIKVDTLVYKCTSYANKVSLTMVLHKHGAIMLPRN